MKELSEKIRLNILNEILKQPSPFGKSDDIMGFLELVWELKILPSEDGRFGNAYDDIFQHIINNDDWDYLYLFVDRLKLIEDYETYQKFLNAIISPVVRDDSNDVMNYYYIIEPYLSKEDLTYILVDYDDDTPVYNIGEKINGNTFIDVKPNEIPFFVTIEALAYYKSVHSFETPEITPSFMLVSNEGWNDFGVISDFNLFYISNNRDVTNIGNVKIIHNEADHTSELIKNGFTELNNEFCSLGQEIDYYIGLQNIFKKRDAESILWALKDVSIYSNHLENFEHLPNFKSLIRYDEPERLLREAKYKLIGYNLINLYSFKYVFKPKYSENELEINFDFDNKYSFDRIIGIIGKNGTGKTQLITSLPIDISKKNKEKFNPKTPIFSKVIAVSYSIFDSFEIPKTTSLFNYKYCGLKNDKGVQLKEEELIAKFYHNKNRIFEIGRLKQWRKILRNFIDSTSLSQFIYKNDEGNLIFSGKNFNNLINQFSSGQSIILFILTEIIANIRYDSIIIYDEPETHLHPNAISKLINTIYELVSEFESYCIIATHSPIIIRELVSKNVYIMERDGSHSSIRKIGIESFGENLSVLTDEVFGNRDIPKQYKHILQRFVDSGLNYEEVLNKLETDGLPLSLNSSIYLNSLLNEKS